jgi:hypothetical protein
MKKFALTITLLALWTIRVVHAAEFFCPAGDVSCLIAAINEANRNSKDNTIFLEPGIYSLQMVDNRSANGLNGLPSITGRITIQGSQGTIIERNGVAPRFRLFHIGVAGTLNLRLLEIRNGFPDQDLESEFRVVTDGGAIFNQGELTIEKNTIYNNNSPGVGGAIFSSGTLSIDDSKILTNEATFSGGIHATSLTLVDSFVSSNVSSVGATGVSILNGSILRSSLSKNRARIDNGVALVVLSAGTVTVTASAIVENESIAEPTVANQSNLTIVNSTIARNATGAIGNDGFLRIINSTISENVGGIFASPPAFGSPGTTVLQNTILAGNIGAGFFAGDCNAAISLGHNIIGDPFSCTVTLQESDLTGDPGLGEFIDDGFPGQGHFPLLPDSPAINSANPDACPETDQLGNPRVGVCDRGSVEFQGRGPLLIVRREVIRAGQSIVVRWRAIRAPTSTDWIGLYLPGSPNTAFIDWIYVSCSKTPGNPDRRGSCDFPIPDSLVPGTYELRLLANDGFMRLASSDGFMVRPRREGLASQAP